MTGPAPFGDVYVIHTRHLRARRKHCERALSALGWQPTWVEVALPRERRPRTGQAPLARGEVDVYLKHVDALHRVAEHGRASFVLEDDPVFPEGFAATFAEYLRALPPAFDLVFFGASCGLAAEPDPANPRFGRARTTRSMSGYLVTGRAAGVLSSVLERRPIAAPIDHAVNGLIAEQALTVFWSVPALIENGSESGRFPRSLGRPRWPGSRAARWIARRLGLR